MRSRFSVRVLVAVVGATIALTVPVTLLASHQFADVPDSNPFHADIDALVDSGVTSGCGGGNYCPSANVTREQMAAFLNRLGALAPDKTPVVNADKVDGLQGTDLVAGTAVIPSGMTVTGYARMAMAGMSDNGIHAQVVQLPGRAPAPIVSANVNFGSSVYAADDDATCTGTIEAPTAPAGKVCIYHATSANMDTAEGLSANVVSMQDRFFRVRYFATSAGGTVFTTLEFTWAYTAP